MCGYADKEDLLIWLDQQVKTAKGDRKKALQDVSKKVISMSDADVKPNIHAKWIKTEIRSMFDGKGVKMCYCSNCRSVGNGKDDYCGKCGASMKVPLYEGCD